VAQDEVGCAVGVDGVVFAEGVEAGDVAAEGHGADAEGAEGGVAWGRGGEGEGRAGFVVPAGVDGADVPELDACVGFGGGEEEVLAACGEELEGCDGDLAETARDFAYAGDVAGAGGGWLAFGGPRCPCMGVVDAVDYAAWVERLRQTIAEFGFGNDSHVLNWSAPAPEVPDLNAAVTARGSEDTA
jgi:hypothetical protein